MEHNREALKTAHDNFAKALDAFGKMVLSQATGKEVARVRSASLTVVPASGSVIVRSGGSCGVYDEATGTCRLCTPEEAEGEIIPG